MIERTPMLVVELDVRELKWDWRNARHGAKHTLQPYIGDAVLLGNPKFFLNKPGRAATHLMIGPDRIGKIWTIGI